MEGNQSSTCEPSASSDVGTSEQKSSPAAGNEVFIEISKNLQPNQWQFFGIVLGLGLNDVLKIEKNANVHHIGSEATVMQMLETWKQQVNPSEHQMVPMLVKALNTIKRKDLADEIANKVVKEKGVENVTVDDLVKEITPTGRALVPDSVKRELLQRIRNFLAQQRNVNV